MTKVGILVMQTNIQEYLEQLDEVLQLFQGFRMIVSVSEQPDLKVSFEDGRVAPLKESAVVKRFGLFQQVLQVSAVVQSCICLKQETGKQVFNVLLTLSN